MEQNSLTSVTLLVSLPCRTGLWTWEEPTGRKSGRSICHIRLPQYEMQSSLVLMDVAEMSDPLAPGQYFAADRLPLQVARCLSIAVISRGNRNAEPFSDTTLFDHMHTTLPFDGPNFCRGDYALHRCISYYI